MDSSSTITSPISHPPSIELLQCADCSVEDPQWASVNRGVLLCTDCCAVHRNLGRHVSQIRSLKKGLWDIPQLELVNLLHRCGSNRVWEHALLDPSSSSKHKKKPTPNDPVVPTKEAFIKAKYVDQAFTLKPSKDDDPMNTDDLNKQLWSCVRTSHVDTTLRLLSLGADPNYSDVHGGNTPLHIAAKEDQGMQVELLFLYGSDPNVKNASDQTPAVAARLEGHTELANRLEELCFEVTNRMSLFLCGRRPDHLHKQHFLIPELTGKSAIDGLRSTRKQLQRTTDSQFVKLAQDVYDEVDRRETQTAWMALTQGKTVLSGNEQCVAVFLPLNPAFSSTRNQLRQKLAKYDVREFATLIIDVLKESKRRYLGEPPEEDSAELNESHNHHNTSRSSMQHHDSNRDYDEVAEFMNRSNVRGSGATRSSGNKTRSTDSIDGPSDPRVSIDDVLELKERLTDSEGKLRTLSTTNNQILKMLHTLQSTMEHVKTDNIHLKNEVMRLNDQLTLVRRLPSPATVAPHHLNGMDRGPSMDRDKNMTPLTRSAQSDIMDSRGPRSRNGGSMTGPPTYPIRPIPSGRMSADHHRERDEIREMERSRLRDSSREKRAREMVNEGEYATVSPVSSPPSKIQEVFSDQDFPDNLVRETEKLTVAIRQLLIDAQHKQLVGRAASDHAHKIASLINQIILLIPLEMRHGKTENTISKVMEATMTLSAKCNAPVLDTEETCHAAYSVAQGAKELLMLFHQ